MTITLAIALAILLVIDWQQTRTIAKNPDKWRELNPLLGEHPPLRLVNGYFALVLAGLAAAVRFVPEDILLVGLAICTPVEGWVVVRNWRKGIRPT